jgi:hypothetical protein
MNHGPDRATPRPGISALQLPHHHRPYHDPVVENTIGKSGYCYHKALLTRASWWFYRATV